MRDHREEHHLGEDPEPQPRRTPWHQTQILPLGMMGAILIQSGTFLWHYAQMTNRVDTIERWIAKNDQVISRLDKIEVRLDYIAGALERAERATAIDHPTPGRR